MASWNVYDAPPLGLVLRKLPEVECPDGDASGLSAYPLVCDLNKAAIRYDNFGGRWGDQRDLDRFLQAYAVEATKLEPAARATPPPSGR